MKIENLYPKFVICPQFISPILAKHRSYSVKLMTPQDTKMCH